MARRPGFLGRLLLSARNQLKAVGMEDESFWSTWSPLGKTTASGDSEMQRKVGDGLSLDVIMAPVLWISRRMAESDIGVMTLDDEVIDHDHPIAKLLRRPNPLYAGSTMRMALAVNYLMDGNAYMRKVRNGMRGTSALVFIPSWCIDPLTESDAYQYRPGGQGSKTEIIPPEDIVHLRFGIDPNNTRRGMSPLKILIREIYTDLQGSTMTAMLLKNAGLMGVIISPKEGVQIAKPTETKKYIEDEFSGVRVGKAMVMTAPTDVAYFGADATKMDLARLREIPEERICAVLNIPSAVVGFGTGMQTTKVGATLVELRAMAYEDCIIPMQNSWCDEIDIQLLPDFEGDPDAFSTQFDNSKVRVLQPDDNAISTRFLAQLAGGGIKLSEFREKMGYETEPAQDVFYIPSSLVVTPDDDLVPPDPPPPVIVPPGSAPGAGGAAKVPSEGKAAEEAAPTKGLKGGLHGPAKMTPKLSRLMHRMLRDARTATRKWEPKIATELKAYGAAVAQKFASVADRRGLKTYEDDLKAAGDEAMQIVMAENVIAPLRETYKQLYLNVARSTFAAINAVMGLGVNLTDQVEQDFLRKGGKRLGLLDLGADTRKAVFEAISDARAAGEGAAGIASRIIDLVGKGPWSSPEIRAQIIARTETKFAQNWSSLEAYRESDTITDVMIFDAQLGDTDEECMALNGETVSMEEAINLMNTEHPNGTRSFAPVVR